VEMGVWGNMAVFGRRKTTWWLWSRGVPRAKQSRRGVSKTTPFNVCSWEGNKE
jgi:hypothetical protein